MSALTKSGESQSHSEQIRQFMVNLYGLISQNQFLSSPAGTTTYRIKIPGTDVSTEYEMPRRIKQLCIQLDKLRLDKLRPLLDDRSNDDTSYLDGQILDFVQKAVKNIKNDYSSTNIGFHLTHLNEWESNQQTYTWIQKSLENIERLMVDDDKLGSDAYDNQRL